MTAYGVWRRLGLTAPAGAVESSSNCLNFVANLESCRAYGGGFARAAWPPLRGAALAGTGFPHSRLRLAGRYRARPVSLACGSLARLCRLREPGFRTLGCA